MIGAAGCGDNLQTYLRDDLASQTELADLLVRVVNEDTAKEYSSHAKEFEKASSEMAKRRGIILEDLRTKSNKGGFLNLHSPACKAFLEEKFGDPNKVKLEDFRKAGNFNEELKSWIDEHKSASDAVVVIKGGGPGETTGAVMEWEAFYILQEKAIGNLVVPDRIVFHTKFYNQYIREMVALEILNKREMKRIKGVVDDWKGKNPDGKWPTLDSVYPPPPFPALPKKKK